MTIPITNNISPKNRRKPNLLITRYLLPIRIIFKAHYDTFSNHPLSRPLSQIQSTNKFLTFHQLIHIIWKITALFIKFSTVFTQVSHKLLISIQIFTQILHKNTPVYPHTYPQIHRLIHKTQTKKDTFALKSVLFPILLWMKAVLATHIHWMIKLIPISSIPVISDAKNQNYPTLPKILRLLAIIVRLLV